MTITGAAALGDGEVVLSWDSAANACSFAAVAFADDEINFTG